MSRPPRAHHIPSQRTAPLPSVSLDGSGKHTKFFSRLLANAGAKKWHRNYPASRRTGRLSDDDSAAQVNRRGDARTDEALCHRESFDTSSDGSRSHPRLPWICAVRALVRQTARAKPKLALHWWRDARRACPRFSPQPSSRCFRWTRRWLAGSKVRSSNRGRLDSLDSPEL